VLLHSITIKRLKSIPTLRIAFSSNADVTLLLGANGIGKTTALQALSLLGHLTTMSLATRSSGTWCLLKPTVTSPKLIFTPTASDDPTHGAEIRAILRASATAREWFESFDKRSSGGACKFVFNYPSMRDRTIIYVYIRDDASPITAESYGRNTEQMSISRMLSAEALTDHEFWRYCTVLIDDGHYQNAQHILHQQHDMRPYADRPLQHSNLASTDLCAAVHYINTDLNDFGRGFDLRESPKDLYKDFDAFCNRFGIHRDGATAIDTLKSLNATLARVITYPRTLQGESTVGKTPLSIQSLMPREAVGKDASQHQASPIVVCRYGDPNISTDFLSSGENEVFFLFLLLICVQERATVIMDEPDLHISSFQKRVFFHELFATAKLRNISLIVSTHSDVALTVRPIVGGSSIRTEARVIRYGDSVTSPMESDFKEDFLIESAIDHWSVALSSIRNVFSFRGWRTLPQLVASQLERNTAQAALYLGVIGGLIVAIVSLSVDLILGDKPDHLEALKKSLLILLGSGTATITLSYAIGKFQARQRITKRAEEDE
jgi:AAA domain, putative AbiEii toxin, Type IV TA system